MRLPESIIQLLMDRRDARLAVGFCPWSDLDGILWGYVARLGPTSIEFELVNSDGSFGGDKTYHLSRIVKFDFDLHYADRLKRLGEREWERGVDRIVRSAAERDAILADALKTGNPIDFRYGGLGYSVEAKVLDLDGDWVLLQFLEEDGSLRSEIEATRRSKIVLKTGPFREAMAWLVVNRGDNQ